MIIVDTNVISEFMASAPAAAVLEWFNDQDSALLFLTTISIAEVNYGLCIMAQGRRRDLLHDRFARFLAEAFDRRVLSFDEAAAHSYGDIMAHRRQIGRPIAALDGQIAAIARSRGFAVATRNVKDFTECDIAVTNPFEQPSQ